MKLAFLRLKYSEEDKGKLREGKEKLLPKPVSEYNKVFSSSVYQYLVLLLSTGHLVYEFN